MEVLVVVITVFNVLVDTWGQPSVLVQDMVRKLFFQWSNSFAVRVSGTAAALTGETAVTGGERAGRQQR
jgi:hypothetical protein